MSDSNPIARSIHQNGVIRTWPFMIVDRNGLWFTNARDKQMGERDLEILNDPKDSRLSYLQPFRMVAREQ